MSDRSSCSFLTSLEPAHSADECPCSGSSARTPSEHLSNTMTLLSLSTRTGAVSKSSTPAADRRAMTVPLDGYPGRADCGLDVLPFNWIPHSKCDAKSMGIAAKGITDALLPNIRSSKERSITSLSLLSFTEQSESMGQSVTPSYSTTTKSPLQKQHERSLQGGVANSPRAHALDTLSGNRGNANGKSGPQISSPCSPTVELRQRILRRGMLRSPVSLVPYRPPLRETEATQDKEVVPEITITEEKRAVCTRETTESRGESYFDPNLQADEEEIVEECGELKEKTTPPIYGAPTSLRRFPSYMEPKSEEQGHSLRDPRMDAVLYRNCYRAAHEVALNLIRQRYLCDSGTE